MISGPAGDLLSKAIETKELGAFNRESGIIAGLNKALTMPMFLINDCRESIERESRRLENEQESEVDE